MKRHKIYDTYPPIVNYENKTISIPMINRQMKVVGRTTVSLEDKEYLLQYSYSMYDATRKTKANYYCKSNIGISMHELVMHGKAPKGYKIDHINKNGIDNRRENLRFATDSQQGQNKDKLPNSSSKYKGVTHVKGNWRIQIKYKNETYRPGTFKDEIEAGKVYDIYAIYLFGKDASTNNLLTESEIQDIINKGIPEEYKIKKKVRDLPTNIHWAKCGTRFSLQIERGMYSLNKTYETLEEAEQAKVNFINKYEESVRLIESDRVQNITRNKLGEAVIYINCQGIIYESIVDDDIWEDVSRFVWSNNYGYFSTEINNKREMLHRYIFQKYALGGNKIPNNQSIDHIISSRKDDNRLKNLRLASQSLQKHNQDKILRDNVGDKYKGVYFGSSSYIVNISGIYYGSYETEEAGASKANEIFREIYGNDAYQNQIDFSKKTTKDNRISEEIITKEFIENIKFKKDLVNIISLKKLNVRGGGNIRIEEIKVKNLSIYKKMVITALFPN